MAARTRSITRVLSHPSKLVQLDANGRLPALDARNLTNLLSEDTTAMNAFISWLAAGRASGPVPKGYLWTFQTDEWNKTNAYYDAAGDYYTNTSGGGLSAPNNLTGDGVSCFSSGAASGYASFKAFDGADKTTSVNGWQTPNDGTVTGEFIGRHFGATGHIVGRILIWNSQYSSSWRNGVKDIVVEGSNDAVANGSGGLSTVGTWTKIPVLAVTGGSVINTDEARINQGSGTGVAATAEITLGGSTAYKAVRIRCTSASWDEYTPDYAHIRELEMYDALSVADMDIQAPPVLLGYNPTKATIYLLHKAVDAVTLNTDIRVSASEVTGWTWATDLEDLGTYNSDYKLLRATIALANANTGIVRAATDNNKAQHIRACLAWFE